MNHKFPDVLYTCVHMHVVAWAVMDGYSHSNVPKQAALKALQAAKTTSLVRQYQQTYDISAQHAVRLYWVPDHAGVRGNEIADRLARSGSGQRFMGLEPFLGSLGRV